jgi:molybdopterin-guanine dinucleotide biosynthesis protein B
MKVIQVVGYKRSGKTTIAKTLIQLLSEKGKRVASLKHHGHGGIPLGIKETDSEKHRHAGALIAGVEGEGVVQLTNEAGWDTEKMLAIYKLFHIENVVVEGFKTADYDKIVLIRDEGDIHLLEQVTNIQAVLTSVPLKQTLYPYPIFKHEEMEVFHDWFLEYESTGS